MDIIENLRRHCGIFEDKTQFFVFILDLTLWAAIFFLEWPYKFHLKDKMLRASISRLANSFQTQARQSLVVNGEF